VRENARLSLLHGEALGMRGEFEPALVALQRARTFFARKGDRRMESLACVKLSTVYNGRGDIALSAEAAEEGLRLVPNDAASIRLRLQGNLALTSAWLGDALEKSVRTLRRLANEASSLGLDHFAAIAHHNLGVLQRDAGELNESLRSLEKAANYWGALPNSPFADNADLVITLLTLGDVARASRLAEAGVASTRNWRRPAAEALGGRAAVLVHLGRFTEARQIVDELLQEQHSLGGLVDLFVVLDAEISCLEGAAPERLRPLADALSAPPKDARLAVHVDTASALVTHQLGKCRGGCLSRARSTERWRSRGAVFAACVAEAKLASLAFDHGRRIWISRAVRALQALKERGALAYVKHWTRRLTPHASALRDASGSVDLVVALHEADPHNWENALIGQLAGGASDRGVILRQIGRHASRRTIIQLRSAPGPDVNALRQELVRQQSVRLFVRTFGPVAIHRGAWDGPSMPIGKRRLRSLLALLAAHSGAFLARETVLEALWPEADPGAAVNNLNQSVYQLRRLLDPDYHDGDGVPYIVATSDQVGFDPRLVRTDLEEFRRLRSRMKTIESVPERKAAVQQVLCLVTGEYLADARYEGWADPHLLAVELEVREALLPVALGEFLPDDPETGLAAARALATLDEFDEIAHSAMARHLAAMGMRRKAASIIRKLATRLDVELGTGLSVEAIATGKSVGLDV
jgi:DNA-binding SARP family transcriptional activator/tetratricopeptide (TPR) repeat protein